MIDAELWKFNDIYFDEGPHTYTDSLNTQYTSVTAFVHTFEAKKDWDKIASNYAMKNGLSTDEVLATWDKNKTIASAMGTQVHAYMENLWKRKHYSPDNPVGDYELVAASGLTAYKALTRRFIPIREELIVYNQAWGLCGTLDLLVYDKVEDGLVILDYKTNKSIKTENKFQKCVGILDDLQDCNYNIYSAQLSTYKAIVERMTTLKIKSMALVHLKRDGWEYIPCIDLSDRITQYLDTGGK